ncbi:hypothetical protein J7K27_06245 [Candidatus Bathyarchaeota archaeon]|nr:hypothetical protein [Candidatus Bathyarchaeota archaeon]
MGGQEFIEVKIPVKLATDLYVKAVVAKISELEDRVKAIERDMPYIRGTLQQVLSIIGAGARKAESRGGI